METKYTKGKWVIESTKMAGTDIVVQTVIKTDLPQLGIKSPIVCDMYGYMTEEGKANAKLIADAGNTANKCGLLPSELLEQRNDLIEALLLFVYEVENSTSGSENFEESYYFAKQAIKKVTE